MDNLPVFCDVDDFCQLFEPAWQRKRLPTQPRLRNRKSGLCLSEVLTILIGFHRSGYRTFKAYYTQEVERHQRADFPGLVSTAASLT